MLELTLDRPPAADRVSGQPDPRRRPRPVRERITVRLRSPRSRELVARSLILVVEDAFRDEIPHLRDALDEPIAVATETAVDTLIDELEDLFDLVPESATEAWDRARDAADLGDD